VCHPEQQHVLAGLEHRRAGRPEAGEPKDGTTGLTSEPSPTRISISGLSDTSTARAKLTGVCRACGNGSGSSVLIRVCSGLVL
jgi:hypothetical protein